MPGRTNTELQQEDTASSPTPIHIEAEAFLNNSGGPTTETCTDTGGGQDLTNLGNTTWSQYVVTVPTAGTYLVKFRVAGSAGQFQFKDSSLNILAVVTVPSTGGSQTWTTVTATVVLPAGTQKLHFYVTQYGWWNMNWFELVLRGADGSNNQSGVGGYRYGFNGKENDNEMEGEGNLQDYGERIYDPRLGKWLSVDPLQAKFAGQSPYNYCYNNPINVYDPDGRLGIYVEVKINKETGRYTVLKVTITDDLKYSGRRMDQPGVFWSDFINIYDNSGGKKNMDYSKAAPIDFVNGEDRTSTLFNWGSNYAKWWVNDGVYEGKTGIVWTSSNGGNEETRKAREAETEGVGALLAAASGGKGMAGYPLKFDSEKALRGFMEKLTNLLKKVGDDGPSKIDYADPEIQKLLGQLQEFLAKNDESPTGSSNTKPSAQDNSTPKIEPGKTKHTYSGYKKGTILHTTTGNVRVDSDSTGTCCQDDKKATDTIPSMKKNKNN